MDRDKTDPQPVEFDIPKSPAGSLIGLYGACFGRLDLECPSKKAHLAGCDCDKSWPGFPQQKQSQSIRDLVYANGSCRRKRSTHPQIARKIEKHGKGFCTFTRFFGQKTSKKVYWGRCIKLLVERKYSFCWDSILKKERSFVILNKIVYKLKKRRVLY